MNEQSELVVIDNRMNTKAYFQSLTWTVTFAKSNWPQFNIQKGSLLIIEIVQFSSKQNDINKKKNMDVRRAIESVLHNFEIQFHSISDSLAQKPKARKRGQNCHELHKVTADRIVFICMQTFLSFFLSFFILKGTSGRCVFVVVVVVCVCVLMNQVNK